MSYRESDLRKGDDYDRYLESDPMDRYMAQVEAKILTKLVPRMFPNGIERYLDFAGGTGRITQLVEQFASDSTAIDISESMQAIAKKKCKSTTFIVADITTEPLDLDPFDLVTSFRFFGNAEHELRDSVLEALSSMTAKGGYLIINNHRNPLAIRELMLRVRGQRSELTCDPRVFRKLLKKHDFKVLRSIAIAPWVIRAKYTEEKYLTANYANHLEYLSYLPGIATFSPDSILVAKKLS